MVFTGSLDAFWKHYLFLACRKHCFPNGFQRFLGNRKIWSVYHGSLPSWQAEYLVFPMVFKGFRGTVGSPSRLFLSGSPRIHCFPNGFKGFWETVSIIFPWHAANLCFQRVLDRLFFLADRSVPPGKVSSFDVKWLPKILGFGIFWNGAFLHHKCKIRQILDFMENNIRQTYKGNPSAPQAPGLQKKINTKGIQREYAAREARRGEKWFEG